MTDGERTPRRPNWLRRFHGGPTPALGRPLMICFPHAGGAASYFAPLARALAPAVEVWAVQYPGRQDRFGEPCLDTVDALAEGVAAALADPAAEVLNRPPAFFGHSMGAVIAYEVALRPVPARPTHLFVSARPGPLRARPGDLHRRDDDELWAEVGLLGGTDPLLLADPDLRDMALPALRADYRAIESYRPRPGRLVDCPITALAGADDPSTTPDEIGEWASCGRSPDFELQTHPGGHFYLTDRVTEVAATVTRRLAIPDRVAR